LAVQGQEILAQLRLLFVDFSRSFLPERIFQIAARRTVSGMLRGATKSGAVISGDMNLTWKRIWSQVAAGLRSPFPQTHHYPELITNSIAVSTK